MPSSSSWNSSHFKNSKIKLSHWNENRRGAFFCIVQHLFFSALHSLCHAKPEKERVKFHWEFLIQFPWMQSNKMLEICECGIAYAQIGRKLFSCSDDNVAFPRSWVISLRDLKLCDERFFHIAFPYSHYFISNGWVCVRVALIFTPRAKHITMMMMQNGKSLANIFSMR